MKIKKVPQILVLLLVASISIAACSPKAVPDQPAEQQTENPFSPAILGDCYNPFSPVIEGKVWKYSMDSKGVSSNLEISYKDVTSSSFTSIQQFPDIHTEVQWTCSPDGMLSNQFANMSIAQIPDVKFETLEVNGMVVPREDKWQVGYSWDTGYVIKVQFTSGESVFEGQGNMTVTNTISAVEPVTVPSGSYNEAFRVDIAGDMIMKIMGTESTIPLTYSTWYVKNIGMVKSASADPTITYSMELTSLE